MTAFKFFSVDGDKGNVLPFHIFSWFLYFQEIICDERRMEIEKIKWIWSEYEGRFMVMWSLETFNAINKMPIS